MSAVSSGSPRHRRGRVVLVGAGESLDRLCEGFASRAVRVGTLFEALGEISISTAADPVELVVVSRGLIEEAERAVRPLRQLDRAVQIALLLDDGPATPREQAMFDFCLPQRAGAQEVEAILNGAPMSAAAAARNEEHVLEAASRGAASRERGEVEIPPRTGAEAGSPKPQIEADRELGGEADRDRPVTLGDTDLVEALLDAHEPRERFFETALGVIREQTGWNDVRLEPAAEGGAAQDGAAVAFGGRVFGLLRSDDAAAAELRAWAVWLARWVALEDAMRDLRCQAMQDELTGAWNRRYFNIFLGSAMARATERRRPVTVMVFDLDDFKRYNDTFGHAAGDEILRETVRLLNSCIRRGDRVCRIGGDEFAVIFADLDGPREAGSAHPETVEQIANRFQTEICRMKFPKLGLEAPGNLSVSAGLATFPWDGRDAATLLEHADQLALQSKRRGKNAITLGPGAQHICTKRGDETG